MNGQILTTLNSIKPVATIHVGCCQDSSSSRWHSWSCAIVMCILVTWWRFTMSTIPSGSLVMRVREITLEQHQPDVALGFFLTFLVVYQVATHSVSINSHSWPWRSLGLIAMWETWLYIFLYFSFVNSCFIQ